MTDLLSTDIICTRFTIIEDSKRQLMEGETIKILANAPQIIKCKNTTAEISQIHYRFEPLNAVMRMETDYIPPHKYELKFFLNSSALLIVGGLNSTIENDADYTLEINFQVQGIIIYTKNNASPP